VGAGQLDQKRSAELRGDDSRLGPHDDAGEPQHYGVCQVNSRHRDPPLCTVIQRPRTLVPFGPIDMQIPVSGPRYMRTNPGSGPGEEKGRRRGLR
jgi:hypothetical protein